MSESPQPLVDVHTIPSGTVVSMLEARLDMERSQEFKQRLDEVIDSGVSHLVLDMAAVSYIDSSGLGTVVSVFKRMPSGTFHVSGLRPNLRTLFQITRLDKYINLFATVDEAVAAFDAPGSASPDMSS